MSKSIIVYYSRAGENYFAGARRRIEVGNTARVAETLSRLTGAETFALAQAVPYSEAYDQCTAEAKRDLLAHARPALSALPDLAGVDTVFLGYPNYWGTMPMAVYTFLESADLAGKRICPFCTHEGSGLSHTVQDIQKAAPGAAVTKGLAIHGSHVAEAKSALAQWVEEVAK